MARHRTFNKKYDYKFNLTLPYLYSIPKLHKSPPKFRYIAGVSNPLPRVENTSQLQRIFNRPPYMATCSTTPASKKLCKYLQTVMYLLRLKDNDLFKKTGCRRCWFVTDIDDVFREIKQNIPILRGLKPRTFDFATMYTNIPHQKIFNNIRAVIEEARLYRETLTSDSIPLLPDPDIIMDHLQFVVSNTFLCNNREDIKQQTIGIPMGTNAAPEIANLTLYHDESQYVDSLIRDGFFAAARRHSHTRRYIDDLLLWDIQPPPPDLYGLDYAETKEADGSVSFLGARISTQANGLINMSVFDKTASWKNFPVIRYTHGESNVPAHQSSGIVLSQLIRYRLICSSIKAFKLATTSLVQKLLERQHSPTYIFRGWNAYLIRYKSDKITNYKTLRIWFKKMMKWASYHAINPLNPRPTLPTVPQSIVSTPPTLVPTLAIPPPPPIPPFPPPPPMMEYPPLPTSPPPSQPPSPRSPSQHFPDIVTDPVHPDITTTPNITFLLTRFENDPVFDSVRAFFQAAQKVLRNKQQTSSLSQNFSCELCSQSFNKLGAHSRHRASTFGCYNITRLKHLICLRKSIPFEAHPSIPETSINALEDHLNQLNLR